MEKAHVQNALQIITPDLLILIWSVRIYFYTDYR